MKRNEQTRVTGLGRGLLAASPGWREARHACRGREEPGPGPHPVGVTQWLLTCAQHPDILLNISVLVTMKFFMKSP